MPTAEQYDIIIIDGAHGETAAAADRTRKPGPPPPPLAPADISNAALLDALHRVTDTGPAGGKLFTEDAEAGAAFVRTIMAGRRVSDLRRAERADVYAKARAFQHPGARAA